MKRRSLFKWLAGLFAAPAVVKAAPAVAKPVSKAVNSIMDMPRDRHEAVFGRGNENPLFKGGPPSWMCDLTGPDGAKAPYHADLDQATMTVTYRKA